MGELSREQVEARLRERLWFVGDDTATADDAISELAPTVAAMLDEARAEGWDRGATSELGRWEAGPINPDEWPYSQNPYRASAAAGAPQEPRGGAGGVEGLPGRRPILCGLQRECCDRPENAHHRADCDNARECCQLPANFQVGPNWEQAT